MTNMENVKKIIEATTALEKAAVKDPNGYIVCFHGCSHYFIGEEAVTFTVWKSEDYNKTKSSAFYVTADKIVEETDESVSRHTVALRKKALEEWLAR